MQTRPLLLMMGLVLAGALALADGPSKGGLRGSVKPFERSEEGSPSAGRPLHGQVQQFEPTALTEEEREAARVRARYKMGTFRETEAPPPEPTFPWGPLIATLLSFAVAAPFAWATYRRHVEDTPDGNALGTSRRRPPTRRSSPGPEE